MYTNQSYIIPGIINSMPRPIYFGRFFFQKRSNTFCSLNISIFLNTSAFLHTNQPTSQSVTHSHFFYYLISYKTTFSLVFHQKKVFNIFLNNLYLYIYVSNKTKVSPVVVFIVIMLINMCACVYLCEIKCCNNLQPLTILITQVKSAHLVIQPTKY